MKLPGKLIVASDPHYGRVVISERGIKLHEKAGKTIEYYIPEAEAERLRERVAKLEQDNDKLTALLVCEDETIHRLEGALRKIASCEPIVPGDCPSIAREALGGGEKR